jgi:hypothetical protein
MACSRKSRGLWNFGVYQMHEEVKHLLQIVSMLGRRNVVVARAVARDVKSGSSTVRLALIIVDTSRNGR